jgi:hypothetical protein
MIVDIEKKAKSISSGIKLNFGSIIAMNLDFFGIQYSFGLQQTNMTPIYSYLGANADQIPLLNLAGPMPRLLVQPIIGAMSDKTTPRFGRRRPYFLISAIICSICLFAMPYNSSIWIAASILWILDAGSNITMEPYRAFVSDKLPTEQHALGFLNETKMAGLSLKHLQRLPNHQTSIVLVGKSTATPDFIAYRNADTQICPIDDYLIESSALLHTTAFALSKEPAKSNILEAFSKAYRSGKYISIDWNYAPATAFWAGFLSHFMQEKPIESCIDHALAIARKKIERADALYKISPSPMITNTKSH